ncbi:hypothetical protein GLOTRDRAFT_71020 [Gloeophyllum trabeum ATCC 11539]|uniref:Nucleoporin Nup120/160-domain-containing protein n=1 Tax=Gloeophyllum trabeum (strain ATCC 11539 / FP-39264 / Madison 617) TaxID=670483 RepID=S7S1B1_GLOTA|nr:uncharacterized protein GLOTRDRAFT_71020 [Gloeophyllum trabeum ATCC 11539]EPQ59509.1 hypothetical protein GLOTRDRAFT_71020 [Gloeophyllum trabeum ATCC 11539]
MDAAVLEAADISSLFPASTATIRLVQTSRRNVPLPLQSHDPDAPVEHAVYSTVLQLSSTETILLRVLNDHLTIELIALTSDVPPIRFVFPAPLLSYPGIFSWEAEELHILAVTNVGSLYRIVVPVYDEEFLWHEQFGGNWCREHNIHSVSGNIEGLVRVQGTHTVAIGLPNGDLLRLEAGNLAGESGGDEWMETIFHHGTFLSSLTSFIPALSASSSTASQIVAMTSYPQPTDIGHIWTLSRDRTLRVWTAMGGCTSARRLPPVPQVRSTTPLLESSPAPGKHHALLDAEPQSLLQVFSADDEADIIYVLAFVPTPSSTSSGGFFHVCRTQDDQLHALLPPIVCSQTSVYCHLQDFMIDGNTLYTLWDRQGRSYVEWIELDVSESSLVADDVYWKAASYAQDIELTPGYLDELLFSRGSLTDKCFEAVVRPGMFSALTLRTALKQYSNACLSLPGPPPPQLQTSYATLGENIAAVVGCTVNLTRDAQTGGLQYDKYWTALRRDWEGFIARCREIERSARWPLTLGLDCLGGVVVVERERAGALVREDLTLRCQRILPSSLSLEPAYRLLDVAWQLRRTVSPVTMRHLEDRFTEITQQEAGFAYIDILRSESLRDDLKQDIDEGLDSWITGRLHGQDKLSDLFHRSLAIVTQRELGVKREEEEVELAISLDPGLKQSRSSWQRMIAASYVADTVNARYELCLCLLVMLLFKCDELSEGESSVVDEVLAIFRGLGMLRHIVRQPTGEKAIVDSAADEMITRMRNMHMSEAADVSSHSLVDVLLAQSGDTYELPKSAHRFLSTIGLLEASSMTATSAGDAQLCERLRLLGYTQVAAELVAWLPRSSPLIYVRARLWLDVGRYDDAARLFESLAGSYEGLPEEEDGHIVVVAPPGAVMSQFHFYLHVSNLFRAARATSYEIKFSQLAISVAPLGTDLQELWYAIIKGYIDLSQYEDAYIAIISTPYEKLKRDCATSLVYRMCDDQAVEQLMSLNFAAFADEVEEALSYKARSDDPMATPCYALILHTWHIRRGDYRNAAMIMYQRGRKLALHPHYTNDLSRQLEAYLTAMNALSLLDTKNAWFVMPVLSSTDDEPRKRRRLTRDIPRDKWAVGKSDAEIVELSDIRYEYALLSARLELMQLNPEDGSVTDHLMSPSLIVMRLAQANQFTTAMSTARSLKVEMSDLFALLTRQCLRLSRDPDVVIQEDTSDWLLTDSVSSWPGTPADRGWRYVRESLARHDNRHTDFKYSKVVFETIMDMEAAPPPWLVSTLEENHHEWLIRTCLRYEKYELTLRYTLSLVRKSDAALPQKPTEAGMTSWLPYNLVDLVLTVCAAQRDLSPEALNELTKIKEEIANRIRHLEKFGENTRV